MLKKKKKIAHSSLGLYGVKIQVHFPTQEPQGLRTAKSVRKFYRHKKLLALTYICKSVKRAENVWKVCDHMKKQIHVNMFEKTAALKLPTFYKLAILKQHRAAAMVQAIQVH